MSGWVVGEAPLADVRVQLLPALEGGDGATARPRLGGKPSDVVRCTRRGFFQITGLAAGGYLLGTGDGERRAVPRWVQVAVDGETVVPEAVAVGRLVQLPVELSPPTHPGGLPWRVAVRPPDAPWEAIPGGFEARPGVSEGQFVFPTLAPGRWELVVAGPWGDMAWLR